MSEEELDIHVVYENTLVCDDTIALYLYSVYLYMNIKVNDVYSRTFE